MTLLSPQSARAGLTLSLTLALYLTLYVVLITAYVSVVFYLARRAGDADASLGGG